MIEKKILRCSLCRKIKTRAEFHKGNLKNGLNCWCKSCVSSYYKKVRLADPEKNRLAQRLWRKKNLEKSRQNSRRAQLKCRLEVLKAYGNKCNCCGEKTIQFLAIDHINGKNKKQRKTHHGGRAYFYLRKMNFPKNGYQILCHNCNLAKGFYGKCPHKK